MATSSRFPGPGRSLALEQVMYATAFYQSKHNGQRLCNLRITNFCKINIVPTAESRDKITVPPELFAKLSKFLDSGIDASARLIRFTQQNLNEIKTV